MPYRPKKPCRHFGCGGLAYGGYCPVHKPMYEEKRRLKLNQRRAEFDKTRPSFRKRGYSAKWDKAARNYLHFHPLCVKCDTVGITEPAKEVDHIKPHKGDGDLFWDANNWQALCKRCHSKKTRRETHAKDSYRTAEC